MARRKEEADADVGQAAGADAPRTELSVRSAAREAPERVALVHGGNAVTWGELAARTDRVRAAVQAHLEAAARPVAAVVGSMGVETVVSVLALLEDRVPFVLLHPRWRRAERDRALLMSGASMVIGEDGGLTMLPAGAASGIPPNRGTGDERQSRPGSRRPGAPSEPPPDAGAVDERRPRPTPRRTGAASGNPLGGGAVVVFTSGSTGRPRGAVLSHAALCASAQAHARVFGWQRGDRWLLSLPTAHVGGLMIVVRSLLARRTIVLGGREPDGSFDAGAALRTIDRRAVTLWSVVPTMLGRLLDRVEGAPPASLRAVLVGGAPAPPALMARARQRGWPVFATYGLTEACSQVAVEQPRETFGGRGPAAARNRGAYCARGPFGSGCWRRRARECRPDPDPRSDAV